MANLSEALRLIRVFHDLKQVELAARLNVSRSHLSEIEKGVKTPSLELIGKYSLEFNIPSSSILFFSEEIDAAENGGKLKFKIASKVIDFLKFIEKKSNGISS